MSRFFFAQTDGAELTANLPSSITDASAAVTQEAADSSVGTLRQGMSEAEIDQHIKSLGDLADRSYKAGDKDSARGWMTAMYAAIAGRSSAHKARLQADLDKRIDELTFGGDWAHAEGKRLA